MKHARKMVLVDAKSLNETSTNKNSDVLVNAINSLTASNEFSRNYFGSRAVSVSQLDKELRELLEREDLDPSEKLKLYSQSLKRYLFLQRSSGGANVTSTPQILPQRAVTTTGGSSPPPPSQLNETSSDSYLSIPDESRTLISTLTPIKRRTPVTPKELHQAKRGHQNNLPRSTPKSSVLREPKDRLPEKYDDFFLNWAPSTSKRK